MQGILDKMLRGYEVFRDKYVNGDTSVMQLLHDHGQQPEVMVVACCDSRVDPALILQCDPGDLFIVRNVANIVPPYEKDEAHHGTSAALEFGICFLNVKHLILLGHSQCGGIQALLNCNTGDKHADNDFINDWVSIIHTPGSTPTDVNACAKFALKQSYNNCLTFPWLKSAVQSEHLIIHLWFFDIQSGRIFTYNQQANDFMPLDELA